MSDELIDILDRIAKGQHTDADIATLCQILGWSDRQTKQQRYPHRRSYLSLMERRIHTSPNSGNSQFSKHRKERRPSAN
jgi:hypothetical protein